MRSIKLIPLFLAVSFLAGCASNHTGNHLSLVANHPSNIALDVPIALMKSAQDKCKRLNANAEISGIDQYKPDALNHPEKMRSVLYYSCVEIPKAIEREKNPSPVRDLAKGKALPSVETSSTRNHAQSPATPLPEQTPTTIRETKPVSAELPIFSTEQGEPAGVGPVVVFEDKANEPVKTQARPVVITPPKEENNAVLVPTLQIPIGPTKQKIEPVETKAPAQEEINPVSIGIPPSIKSEPKGESLSKTSSESRLEEIPLETGGVIRIEEYSAEDEYL